MKQTRLKLAKVGRVGKSLLGLAALLLLACGALRSAAAAMVETDGPYDLTWSTVDGGGYTFSTGGDYTLGGTVGQPDAGLLTGGDYTLAGGFWGGGAEYDIYLPVVLRNL
jgi:hypothetical protein